VGYPLLPEPRPTFALLLGFSLCLVVGLPNPSLSRNNTKPLRLLLGPARHSKLCFLILQAAQTHRKRTANAPQTQRKRSANEATGEPVCRRFGLSSYLKTNIRTTEQGF